MAGEKILEAIDRSTLQNSEGVHNVFAELTICTLLRDIALEYFNSSIALTDFEPSQNEYDPRTKPYQAYVLVEDSTVTSLIHACRGDLASAGQNLLDLLDKPSFNNNQDYYAQVTVSTEQFTNVTVCFTSRTTLLLVYRALIDDTAWPEGSLPREQRLGQLSEFIASLPLQTICTTGIRDALVQCLDGYRGKKLITLLGKYITNWFHARIKQILSQEGKIVLDHFKAILWPWILEGEIPKDFADKLFEQGELKNDLEKDIEATIGITLNSNPRVEKIQNYINCVCDEAFLEINCDFHPVLDALIDLRKKYGPDFHGARSYIPCLDVWKKLQTWIEHDFNPKNEEHLKALNQIKRLFHIFAILEKSEQDSLSLIGITLDSVKYFTSKKESEQLIPEVLNSLEDGNTRIDQFYQEYGSTEFLQNYFGNLFSSRDSTSDAFKQLALLFSPTIKEKIQIADDEALNLFFQPNKEDIVYLEPYQINQILLNSFLKDPNEITPYFITQLEKIINFIENNFENGENNLSNALKKSSYPQELLDFFKTAIKKAKEERGNESFSLLNFIFFLSGEDTSALYSFLTTLHEIGLPQTSIINAVYSTKTIEDFLDLSELIEILHHANTSSKEIIEFTENYKEKIKSVEELSLVLEALSKVKNSSKQLLELAEPWTEEISKSPHDIFNRILSAFASAGVNSEKLHELLEPRKNNIKNFNEIFSILHSLNILGKEPDHLFTFIQEHEEKIEGYEDFIRILQFLAQQKVSIEQLLTFTQKHHEKVSSLMALKEIVHAFAKTKEKVKFDEFYEFFKRLSLKEELHGCTTNLKWVWLQALNKDLFKIINESKTNQIRNFFIHNLKNQLTDNELKAPLFPSLFRPPTSNHPEITSQCNNSP